MKARTLLEYAKRCCRDKNCRVGKCPFAYSKAHPNKGYSLTRCRFDDGPLSEWDVDAILKAAKHGIKEGIQ